jgi:hypothetical protein
LKQNSLLWLWLQCISDETGNDTETLSLYFKKKFLPWRPVDVFGEEVAQVQHTSGLDSKEFTTYLDKIKEFALQEGIFLPEPGEQAFDDFYARYGVRDGGAFL